MIFQYQALDKSGNNVSDYIDAPSEMAARQKIRGQGLYVVKLRKQDIDTKSESLDNKKLLKSIIENISNIVSIRFISKQIGLFSRQLATLLKAGLPLPTAITDIVEQIDNKHFKKIIANVKEKLEEGSSFSNALSLHRVAFSEMYINMVRVGENLGSLDHVIERLAEIEEKKNILKSKVQSALWYPLFMLIFAIVVVMFLMVNVIPQIAKVFEEQKKSMPLPTEIVIGISNFLSSFWWLILLLIPTAIFLYNRYIQTEEGRRKIDGYKLRIPLLKNLYKRLIVLKFTQNLGILLSNRVDIIKSFEIVEKIVGNVIVEEKIAEAAKKIKEGSPVSKALSKSDFLPKMVLGMITAGEASDNLDKMLVNIGNVYETELDLTVSSLTSVLEPFIIIIMGFVMGLIVISVMLPIMDMNMLIQ